MTFHDCSEFKQGTYILNMLMMKAANIQLNEMQQRMRKKRNLVKISLILLFYARSRQHNQSRMAILVAREREA
jgi:hypothetical protein